jgi:hypothetical protein
MSFIDAFGESWLGQKVSLQTERSHMITLNGKRFAIAVYDGKVDNKAPLLISTSVGDGSLVLAWGSTSPDNLTLFHKLFEAVLGSLNLR